VHSVELLCPSRLWLKDIQNDPGSIFDEIEKGGQHLTPGVLDP
jgi:hypothetical protein